MSEGDGQLPKALVEQLAVIRANYARKLPARIAAIEEAWRGLESAWDEQRAVAFRTQAHALAGSGTSFGFPRLTDAARALDQALKDVLEQRKPPAPERKIE